MDNGTIAHAFEETATLLRLTGANDFKCAAWERGARLIESLDTPILDLVARREHTDLKGIGKSLAKELETLAAETRFPTRDALQESLPGELIRWLEVPGLGPKTAYKVHKALAIDSLTDLKAACEDGRVAELPGLGQKKADKIVQSIEWLSKHAARCIRPDALAISEQFSPLFENMEGIDQWSVAGSLRRGRETIGDIDFLVACSDDAVAHSLVQTFCSYEPVTEILAQGETKASVRTREGRQIDLRVVQPKHYGASLLYFTGSKEHNIVLRGAAREKGLALNEYGLFVLDANGDTDFEQPTPAQSEQDLYAELDLPWVPPELREDRGEFEWLKQYAAEDLVSADDLQGIVHAHSTWSDGAHSVEEMARGCIDQGYAYLGLTDHSQTAAYAGGLSPDDVKRQWDEIDLLNEAFAREGKMFRVFKGIESDILPDGSLDYHDDLLAGFDFVIGSVHAQIDMDPARMLERYLHALDHPALRMIGHPTGRLLLKREGSVVDLNPIIEKAAARHVVIEINANPHRLDLDWRYGRKARQEGLLSSINPDAHSVEALSPHIPHGTAIARKAGFTAQDILNTRSLDGFQSWVDAGA